MRTLSALIGLGFLCFVLASLFGRPVGVAAGTAVRMDFPELVENAELILEGRVLSAAALEVDGRIETEFLFEVERTFEGPDEAYRAIRLPGGVLPDGSGMMLAGMPRIVPGEDMLVFLSSEGRSGVRMPVGLAQGKFTIVDRPDGTRFLTRDSSGLGLMNPASGTMLKGTGRTMFEYADVVARIEAALVSKRAR